MTPRLISDSPSIYLYLSIYLSISVSRCLPGYLFLGQFGCSVLDNRCATFCFQSHIKYNLRCWQDPRRVLLPPESPMYTLAWRASSLPHSDRFYLLSLAHRSCSAEWRKYRNTWMFCCCTQGRIISYQSYDRIITFYHYLVPGTWILLVIFLLQDNNCCVRTYIRQLFFFSFVVSDGRSGGVGRRQHRQQRRRQRQVGSQGRRPAGGARPVPRPAAGILRQG